MTYAMIQYRRAGADYQIKPNIYPRQKDREGRPCS